MSYFMTKEDLEQLQVNNESVDDLKLRKLERDLEAYRKDQRDSEIKDSLKAIGDATLSSLVSISTFTADALDKIVKDSMEANRKAGSSELARTQMIQDLELKKKNYLREQKRTEKALRKQKKKFKNKVSVIVFAFMLITGAGFWPAVIFSFLSGYLVDKFYEPKLEDSDKKKPIQGKDKVSLPELTEYQRTMLSAERKLESIYSCVSSSKDGEVQVQAGKLYDRGLEILSYLKNHPKELSKASRFLSYYLDTAANICKRYREIESKGIVNEDTVKATENAKRAMVLLETAFDNEFMKLLEDDITDIETDMKVLENSMKWDNYIE
ncbi:MAG: 5-bromo-4-chloroindolyl phosphate hydrolysis family protein [Bacillota bacterium]|nr:5-bromo-4-chloroindolyl phosphate hydrolysis family protein [Bacillota bacterium]